MSHWLRALALAALLVPAAAAQAPPLDAHIGVHILTVGPDGTLQCDEASEAQAEALRADARRAPLALTPLESLNAPGSTRFRIVLRATNQLLGQPEALLAFRRAAARWERIIQNDVTTVIDVDYGPERFNSGPYGPNVLGSTNSSVQFLSETSSTIGELVAALRASTTDPADLAIYNAIPVPTPSTAPTGTGGRTLNRAVGGLIPLQVLGFRPAVLDPADPALSFGNVPTVGFNSAFAYDFNPADGVTAGRTDFEGVAVHEIGHALGFQSAIGFSDPANTAAPISASPWDLFRVRPDAVVAGESLTDGVGFETALRVITPGPPNTETLAIEGGTTYFKAVQVTFAGSQVFETSTATGGRLGGDGQQASHWRDDALRLPSLGAARKIGIMDPNIGTGTRDEISPADIRLLDLIGYEVSYNPPTTTLALSVNGAPVTEPLLVAERSLGDVAVGATGTAQIQIGNAGAVSALTYGIEVVVDRAFPSDAALTTSLSQSTGSVAPGGTDVVTFSFNAGATPALVFGRFRLQANDEARDVIEVPFTFSAGGGTEPRLALTTTAPTTGDLGDIAPDGQASFTATLANTGSLPLEYRVTAAAAARTLPFSSTPASTRLMADAAARGGVTLFSASFESPADLTQFQAPTSNSADRWQVTTGGRATLPGHSAPNAAYFGRPDGSFRYSDNTSGQLLTPVLDLRSLSGDHRVALTFTYSLGAEVGWDFASVIYSIDGGETFETVATSDDGVLTNTGAAWETVVVDLPGLAGVPEVVVGFRFTSDSNTNDTGFFIDDVAITATPGAVGFFASSVVGTVDGNSELPVVITANGAGLARGFYRGTVTVRTNQRAADPAPIVVTFSVGAPAQPTIVAEAGTPVFSVLAGQVAPQTLALRNPGDAPLAFVRVLEPAASSYASAPNRIGGDAVTLPTLLPTTDGEPDVTEATSGPAATTVAQLNLTGVSALNDIAQLPDGQVVVVDGGSQTSTRIYTIAPDLSAITGTYTSTALGGQVTGLAYNKRTGTLWVHVFETKSVREIRLAGTSITPTGRQFAAGFAGFGMDYSPELDAFLLGVSQSPALYAFDLTGTVLPGYPVNVAGRNSSVAMGRPGLSFTEGLLEMTTTAANLIQVGQFGRTFPAAAAATLPVNILGAQRSVVDPNGTFYITSRTTSGAASVRSFDPADLPAGVGTRLEAAAPLFSNQGVAAGATFSAALLVDATGLANETVTDEIAFLTNQATAPLVRIPVTINVQGTTAGEAAPEALALGGVFPNPAREAAAVRLSLPAAVEVSVSVYNALGQRVGGSDRTLLAAGAHDLPLATSGLAAGLYIVRVEAGATVATQKLTVVR